MAFEKIVAGALQCLFAGLIVFPNVPHMNLIAVYLMATAFTLLFTYVGIRGFTKRVIS